MKISTARPASLETLLFAVAFYLMAAVFATARPVIKPGEIWPDNRGQHIQAHGGGILKFRDTYYWFGEDRSRENDRGRRYVSCYSSTNLADWTFRNQVVKLADPENLGQGWISKSAQAFITNFCFDWFSYFIIDSIDGFSFPSVVLKV